MLKDLIRKFWMLPLMGVLIFGVVGCDDDDGAEDVGEAIDDAADDVKDAVD